VLLTGLAEGGGKGPREENREKERDGGRRKPSKRLERD